MLKDKAIRAPVRAIEAYSEGIHLISTPVDILCQIGQKLLISPPSPPHKESSPPLRGLLDDLLLSSDERMRCCAAAFCGFAAID